MRKLHSHMLLVFAVLVLILVTGIFAYMYVSIGTSLDDAALAQSAMSASQTAQVRQQSLAKLYQSMSGDWSRLSAFVIPSDNVVAFIESLERTGVQSGAKVTVSGIDGDTLDDKPAGTFGTVTAHVVAEGSWSSVMRALELAEDMPYAVKITDVRLSTSVLPGDKAEAHGWRLTFAITAATMVPYAAPAASSSETSAKEGTSTVSFRTRAS